MTAAVGLQELYDEYKNDGLMVMTMINYDADGNLPDADDCADWANSYGTSHPILADTEGFATAVMREGEGYPFYMLISGGMEVKTLASGAEAISDEEIIAEIESL